MNFWQMTRHLNEETKKTKFEDVVSAELSILSFLLDFSYFWCIKTTPKVEYT
jgi:hypothetical protein